MEKHTNKIIAIVGIILLILFLWKAFSTEEPYNKVVLLHANNILNETGMTYIDTTVSVGLNAAGVVGANVIIKELTPEVMGKFNQDQLGVELYGAIVGSRYNFILYIRDVSRFEAVKIVAHEIIHLMQYRSARLMVLPPDRVIWEDDTLTSDDIYNIPYVDRPWEREAFDGEDGLSDKMEQILYGKNM